MKLFTNKKKDELTNNNEELQTTQGNIAEKENKIRDYNSAMKHLKIELSLDDTDSSVKKRISKLEKAIEKTNKEVTELRKREGELQDDIGELSSLKEKQRIQDLLEKDAESYERYSRGAKLRKLAEKVETKAYDHGGSVSPENLKKEAGISVGWVTKDHNFRAMWEEKQQEIASKLDNEIAEIEQAIENFLKK